ncbi:hypothetical protein ACWCZ5_30680, partial [Streptomyces sp. NPDC001667]
MTFTVDADELLVTGISVAVVCDGWTISTPGFSADLSEWRLLNFDSARALFTATPDIPYLPAGPGGVIPRAEAQVGFQTGEGPSGERYVSVSDEGSRSTVSGIFEEGAPVASFSSLIRLPFVDQAVLDGLQVPPEIEAVFSAITLTSVSARYDWGRARFDELALSLSISTRSPWTVIPGAVECEAIDRISVRAERDEETGAWRVAGELGVVCSIGASYQLTGEVDLPGPYVRISVRKPAPGEDFIGEHLAGTGITPPATLEYLTARIDVPGRNYNLTVGMDTSWQFAEGVRLTGVDLELSGSTWPPENAALAATLDVDGTPVIVEGYKTDSVWGVRASAFGVEFGGFSSWFERTFGAALPGVVAGLVLDRFV